LSLQRKAREILDNGSACLRIVGMVRLKKLADFTFRAAANCNDGADRRYDAARIVPHRRLRSAEQCRLLPVY
jgi:hypothetical protein